MNKELEKYIEDMANKKYPSNWRDPDKDYEEKRGYRRGIKDADATGFAQFYMEFHSELEEGNLSVSEAYIQYLNREK